MSNYIKKFLFNYITQALIFLSISIVITISLVTYSPNDQSLNLVTYRTPENFLGAFGAHLADLLYQIFGLGAAIIPIYFISWAVKIFRKSSLSWLYIRLIIMLIITTLISIALGNLEINFLPASGGGAIGILTQPHIAQFGLLARLGLWLGALAVLIASLGVNISNYKDILQCNIPKITQVNFHFPRLPLWRIFKIYNIIKSCALKLKEAIKIFGTDQYPPLIKRAPILASSLRPQERKPLGEKNDEILNNTPVIPVTPQYEAVKYQATKAVNTLNHLPSVDLLKMHDNQHIKAESANEIKSNAEKLLSVLGDFGVKGQVIDVSQGPVVTMYEFEPAAGTKSSRVIGLADDIARSLSALSTRIAVVAGRNALGIELPNKQRAFCCLRELIETPEYQDPNISLPLILGKDLTGKPFIADLAKMPHLLVAGTTGSGKSVAINAMIMSLLYRYTPAECRLIMIDPKMLELSIYDNIPHLLTPVVTESGKAVVALKWAVKEMENRYRLMSNVGVRNIANFNAKIAEATKEGKNLERTVQTGFDPETGKPIYESIPISIEKLPFIVVIVDEMADLMIVAGKDIESSIQRLAQMARAAGIHIIMATQRPSVDVITGVIKANFPSRISFKVTSKIDSRTILGEQGSEQLLGMGDMLYMGNSSRILRVHGPFVDDKEVEKVTNYLRSLGTPDYLSDVTETAEEASADSNDLDDGDDDESIYKRAVQIVKSERKVSISYIQRCLRIGYNRAANVIDRMERDRIISPPNHTGKRDILLDD